MQVSYDKAVLEKAAQALYSQARSIIITYAFVGLVVGAGAVFFYRPDFWLYAGVAGAVLGGLLGHSKGLILRMQAQIALGIVQLTK